MVKKTAERFSIFCPPVGVFHSLVYLHPTIQVSPLKRFVVRITGIKMKAKCKTVKDINKY